MPTRIYVCESCQQEVELFQKMSEGAPQMCPKCGAEGQMKQVLTSSHRLYFGKFVPLKDRMK